MNDIFVISKAPVIEEETSSANGKKTTKRKLLKPATKKKIKTGYGKFRDAGGVSFIENILGVGANEGGNGEMPTGDPSLGDGGVNAGDGTKPPMSTTTKVVIGVAVAAVVGGIIYYVVKNKSAKSAK